MGSILHLSDVHISGTKTSDDTLRSLAIAIETMAKRLSRPIESIFVTGDLFDTSKFDPSDASHRFIAFRTSLLRAIGRDVPMVVLPGNHDRRDSGLFGRHDPTLFTALSTAARAESPSIFVAGEREGTRAEIVPAPFHGLPAVVATYDSTVLLRGYVSAGGEIRQEDLLFLESQLGRASDKADQSPLFLLLHHHIIPTPLTDYGRVDTSHRNFLERFAVTRILPALVANADREELTMTALGGGSALSTLQFFGRPVVVLHGHKHYPTARVVVGLNDRENDVALLSAGSAGTSEGWYATGGRDAGHLWPSFNVIEMSDSGLRVSTWAFSVEDGRLAAPRPLIRLKRSGLRWIVEEGPSSVEPTASTIDKNEARFTLISSGSAAGRWTLDCTRSLSKIQEPHSYPEIVEAAPRATVEFVRDSSGDSPKPTQAPFKLRVSTEKESSYRIRDGVCRTLKEAERAYDNDGTTFEWVGLVNRVPSNEATLHLAGLPKDAQAFGSVTDMTTGREEPIALEATADGLQLRSKPCPARRLLRIYWALEAPTDGKRTS